jgi:Fe-S cluster assembly protein SufD
VNPLEAARDHYLARQREFARELGDEPGWLAARRSEARERFAEQGFPATALEDWRHTNLAPLARVPFERARPGAAVSREAIEELCSPLFACSLFVFVDGGFRPELSAGRALSGGVPVESLARLRAQQPERLAGLLGELVDAKRHPFAALNAAFLDDGAVLRVPEGSRDDRPVHVVFLSTGAHATHPRVLVDAAAGSRAALIVDHVSLGAQGGFSNAVCEVAAARGAEVSLVLLQRESAQSFHVSNLGVRQQRDSRVRVHTLSLGGALVRNDLGVLLADEGATCGLDGLFVAGGDALVDHHTLVDHAVPRCTSRELYKGILAGRARGVFRGRIVVRPDAQRTDAAQSNPNLLLSEGSEIDSQPQLEIYADDVKCSHGSSIGRLDADALFFLRSRGIDEPEARHMLTRAFAAEVLERLPVPALADALDEWLRARLPGAEAARS